MTPVNQWSNQPDRFGWRARLLHYGGALLIVTVLVLGLSFDWAPQAKKWTISFHKLMGFIALWWALVWVVLWVAERLKPAKPADMTPVLWLVAKLTKIGLLVCAVLMPLSGWLMSAAAGRMGIPLFGIDLPNPLAAKNPDLGHMMWNVHENAATLLMILLGAHIAGALYHHFIRRDTVLHRMFPFIRRPKPCTMEKKPY